MKLRATRLFVVPRKKGTWVELELKDVLGAALAGERYRVTGAAEDVHEGVLDAAGFARVDALSVGRCRITFPDLDGAEWDWEVPHTPGEDREGTAAAPPPPTAWVEIELLDADRRPLAGAAYRLVLPDGEVREGKLGPDGRSREESKQPGACKLSFPDLDANDWGPADAPPASGANQPASTGQSTASDPAPAPVGA